MDHQSGVSAKRHKSRSTVGVKEETWLCCCWPAGSISTGFTFMKAVTMSQRAAGQRHLTSFSPLSVEASFARLQAEGLLHHDGIPVASPPLFQIPVNIRLIINTSRKPFQSFMDASL